jgi:hypothetical protein
MQRDALKNESGPEDAGEGCPHRMEIVLMVGLLERRHSAPGSEVSR